MPLRIYVDPNAVIDTKANSPPGYVLYRRRPGVYTMRTRQQYPKGFTKLVTPQWRAMTLEQRKQWQANLARAQNLPPKP